jgi:hypothetical protein
MRTPMLFLPGARVCVLTCLLMVLWTSVILAQAGRLGIFADPSGTQCDLVDGAPGLLIVHVFHYGTPGATSVSFSAPIPSCMTGAVFLSDTHIFPGTTGNSQTGITIPYGACQSSPIHILSINLLALGTTQDCCEWTPLAHPNSELDKIEVTDCSSNLILAGGMTSIIQWQPHCYCTWDDFIPEVLAPTPADTSQNVSLNPQLSWATFDPDRATSDFRLKFGTDPNPPVVANHFSVAKYDVGPLLPGTTYYWSVGIWVSPPQLAQGPLWSFTTTDGTPVDNHTWGAIKAIYK